MSEKEKHEHTKAHESGHEHKTKHKQSSESSNLVWMISSVILLVLLVISIFTAGFGLQKASASGTDVGVASATTKAVGYINTDVLASQGITAKMLSSEEKNGLYMMNLSVGTEKVPVYVTKDAKYIFVNPIEIKEGGATPTQAAPAATTTYTKSDKPKVLLFTMAYCPYGNQAESGMLPAAKLLGNLIDFEPHYVIYQNFAKQYGQSYDKYCWDVNETYCSMHGIQELNQDIRELCIWKNQKDKYVDFVLAVNTACTAQNVDLCWEAVATKNGVDVANVKSCFANDAVSLLANEVKLNQQYGVQGSPQMLINGDEYTGGRTADAYKSGVCSAFNTAPSACATQLNSTAAAASGSCG